MKSYLLLTFLFFQPLIFCGKNQKQRQNIKKEKETALPKNQQETQKIDKGTSYLIGYFTKETKILPDETKSDSWTVNWAKKDCTIDLITKVKSLWKNETFNYSKIEQIPFEILKRAAFDDYVKTAEASIENMRKERIINSDFIPSVFTIAKSEDVNKIKITPFEEANGKSFFKEGSPNFYLNGPIYATIPSHNIYLRAREAYRNFDNLRNLRTLRKLNIMDKPFCYKHKAQVNFNHSTQDISID